MQSLTFFQPMCWVWLLLLPGETQGQDFVDKTLRVLTFQPYFFLLLLIFAPWCVLEQAQMMGWCCSSICRGLALLALLFPLWERGCRGLSPSAESPHSDPDPWEVLHRHKRSWVWNQFFVLEEYTGNEPLYVGKVSVESVWLNVVLHTQETQILNVIQSFTVRPTDKIIHTSSHHPLFIWHQH